VDLDAEEEEDKNVVKKYEFNRQVVEWKTNRMGTKSLKMKPQQCHGFIGHGLRIMRMDYVFPGIDGF
jgi:hypothetical protein